MRFLYWILQFTFLYPLFSFKVLLLVSLGPIGWLRLHHSYIDNWSGLNFNLFWLIRCTSIRFYFSKCHNWRSWLWNIGIWWILWTQRSRRYRSWRICVWRRPSMCVRSLVINESCLSSLVMIWFRVMSRSCLTWMSR